MRKYANRYGARPRESWTARFWARVNKAGPTPLHVPALGPCWLWMGCRSRRQVGSRTFDYGYAYDGVRIQRAHRLAWQFTNGAIPDGLCVLHRCDNPRCVNPAHLFLGTQRDNAQDRERKGRRQPARGERSGRAKLTWQQVEQIRSLYTARAFSQTQLAEHFGVHQTAISAVIRRKSWTQFGN